MRPTSLLLAAACASCQVVSGLDEYVVADVSSASSSGAGAHAGAPAAGGQGGGGAGCGEIDPPGSVVTLSSNHVLLADIAVDDVDVFWAAEGQTYETGEVWRAAKRCGAPVKIAEGERMPDGLALTDAFAYWRAWYNPHAVRRYNRQATAPIISVVEDDVVYNHIGDVAADATRVYWTIPELGSMRFLLHGSDDEPTELANNFPQMRRLDASDPAYVYFVTMTEVLRVGKGGTAISISDVRGYDVGVDDARVYWTGIEGDILSSDRDGLDDTVLATGYPNGIDIAVDQNGDYLYWVTGCVIPGASLFRLSKRGGTPEAIVEGPCPFAVAVDETHVYWVDRMEGTVNRYTKKP